MKITFHGGECCGIRHISGFGTEPNAKLSALEAIKYPGDRVAEADTYGLPVSSCFNVYTLDAPEETYVERLDRYLKFLDEFRPQGITEVTLADDGTDYDNQLPEWEPLLLERGFVPVTNCYNSNSGNRVYVYHRKTDKE